MKFKLLAALAAMSIMVMTGCQTAGTGTENTGQQNQPVPFQQTRSQWQEFQSDFNQKKAQEAAKRLAELAARIPQVEQATAVVIGDMAVVGIDVSEDLDRTRVGTIKYTVSEALAKDELGKQAIITADPDLFRRLQEMNEEIQRGRPIQGIAEELGEIVGRIMPQMPPEQEKIKQSPKATPTPQTQTPRRLEQ